MSTKPAQKSDVEKNLDKLKGEAEKARQAASVASEKAAKEGATDADKAKAIELEAKAVELETARGEAQTAFDQETSQQDSEAEAERLRQAQESLTQSEPGVASKEETAARLQAEEDAKFVPVFTDEDGEKIPRNSRIRVQTTTGRNLRALDGTLITPEPSIELNGPDIRKGDWYTVQFAAKLIEVVSTRKLK